MLIPKANNQVRMPRIANGKTTNPTYWDTYSDGTFESICEIILHYTSSLVLQIENGGLGKAHCICTLYHNQKIKDVEHLTI